MSELNSAGIEFFIYFAHGIFTSIIIFFGTVYVTDSWILPDGQTLGFASSFTTMVTALISKLHLYNVTSWMKKAQHIYYKTFPCQMVSKKIWRSKKSFPRNMRAWADRPPLSCCWENVKKCQNITYGYFVKNSKTRLSIVKQFLPKFSKKHVPMGILTKIFKNLPVI